MNGKIEMARATMEGICFENRMMLETLFEADLPKARSVRIIGGASNSDFWNQMQADIYGLPVETIDAKEATALGAGIIGFIASGIYGNYKEASDHMTHVRKQYRPNREAAEGYDEVYELWKECYRGLSQGAFGRIHAYQLRTK